MADNPDVIEVAPVSQERIPLTYQEPQPQVQQPYDEQMAPDYKEVSSLGMDPEIAAPLVYFFSIFSQLFFILFEKKNTYIRFHAWQGLPLFGILLFLQIISSVVNVVLGMIVWGIFLIIWIFLMYQAYSGVSTGDRYHLPVFGDFADQQLKRESMDPAYGNYHTPSSDAHSLPF
eukprot:GCRY01000661.1.p1 GENE.GCRY01000661.1~~GCRY01000661.1.p1  ORF type:complete len:174 (-),score=26.47 GCRY01000661.1:218-739(-)